MCLVVFKHSPAFDRQHLPGEGLQVGAGAFEADEAGGDAGESVVCEGALISG